MVILGIDPGSRTTGWGVLHHSGNHSTYLASGSFRLERIAAFPERLLKLSEAMESLLTRHQPDHCAIERIFMGKNARSALVLGHARGVILSAIAGQGVALYEYTATQVKQSVTGGGRADKGQVQRMVGLLLGRNGRLQADEADALAIALTHSAFATLAGRIG